MDDLSLNQNVNFKVNKYYSNLIKSEWYSFSGFVVNFFYFKEVWKYVIQKVKYMFDFWVEFYLEDIVIECVI